ncbi:MAG: response regulator [Clostridiales bacterium]|jgi:signal transduction histidine kinase/DNA-binding response OmpR family regulator|nr:response regulator [Clostridiales bacterium]
MEKPDEQFNKIANELGEAGNASDAVFVNAHIVGLLTELKQARLDVKKMARELRYQTEVNARNIKRFEMANSLNRAISQEMNKLENFMTLMLDAAVDIIFLFNKDAKLMYVSTFFLNLCGLSSDTPVKGKSFQELLNGKIDFNTLEDMLRIFRQARAQGTSAETIQRIKFSDSSPRYYNCRFISMAPSEANGFIVTMTDFTDLMEAKESAEEAKEAAITSNLAKSDFLSRMSHEIRTPMNAIIGMTNIGRSSNDVARKEYCLSKISEAGTHLLGLINDILDISKIEADKFELSASEFNLSQMLSRVVGVLRFRVDEKFQHLLLEIGDDLPANISADEQRLSQVLINLIGNAVKFTPDQGRITLAVEKTEDDGPRVRLRFRVSDTGIGISKEALPRLFNSFEQADGGISRKFGGTGLGLAISKRIIEIMGGNIWIESEEGVGSDFIFEITVLRGESQLLHLSDEELASIRVLVVDDYAETLEVFGFCSEIHGFSAEAVSSRPDALAALTLQRFDVIFIAVPLSGASTVDFAKEVSALCGEDAVIVMMCQANTFTVRDDVSEVGIAEFIPKPVNEYILIEALHKAIRARDTRREARGQGDNIVFPGKSILVAEDMEINREILSALLEETQLSVDFAEDGYLAVHMFSNSPEKYDLIFMDVNMPNLDGYGATSIIRGIEGLPKAKTIPIIAMTANVFKEDIDRCLEAGMNEHLGKPVDVEELMRTLRKYLC